MKNKFLIILFSLGLSFCFAQKVEILHRSDFRHEYVIGQLVYIERPADTARLKYIATLKVSEQKYDGYIEPLVERLVTEGKALGANSFIFNSYEEAGSSISVTVRVFFGSMKFLEENEKYCERGKIYLFSAEKEKDRKQYFYLNDSLVEFPSDGCYLMSPGDNTRIKITSYKPLPSLPIKLPHKFKKKELSKFIVIRNHLNMHLLTVPVLATGLALALFTGGGFYIGVTYTYYRKNGDLEYKHGRILLDMYKLKAN